MALEIGASTPLVQRRVEASTICFSEEAAPAGKFVVRVACYVTRSFEFRRRGVLQDLVVQEHTARSTPTTFEVEDLDLLESAAACRGTLRAMLAALPQLRALGIPEDDLDDVVPGDIVPEIVRAAGRGSGFTFFFLMQVQVRVINDERALVIACKEWLASTPPGEKAKNCAICVDGLEREYAVELPGCKHPFHRLCISTWFSISRAATCPICRGDVWYSALPQFI